MKPFLTQLKQIFKPINKRVTNQQMAVNFNESNESRASNNANENAYFQTANSWADDIYAVTIASRNRYKIAFLASLGLCGLLACAVMVLAPMQSIELAILHKGVDGNAWVSLAKPNQLFSTTWLETQADIAHYVRVRESYDPLFYTEETKEVDSFSSPEVYAAYELSQSGSNTSSGINVLGSKGYRSITINSVMQLDSVNKNTNGKGNHVNLAQVNFVVKDNLFGINRALKIPYMVLISWTYRGVPSTPEQRLLNYNGFTITKYNRQPINVDHANQT